MELKIDCNKAWYHGSDKKFDVLYEGSTITQWKALAEAFSHKPNLLCCNDDGTIVHDGVKEGFLYIIDEPIDLEGDIYAHPRTTMDKNAEFLTKRPLKVKMVAKV